MVSISSTWLKCLLKYYLRYEPFCFEQNSVFKNYLSTSNSGARLISKAFVLMFGLMATESKVTKIV